MNAMTHRVRTIILLLCGLLPVCAGAAPAQPPVTQPAERGRFIRFVDDAAGGGKLQTAIVTYANDAGVTVHLVAAVHVGEKAYYEELNKTFESYDALLYELIKPKGAKPPVAGQKSRSAVGSFQRILKDVLSLDFQLDDIDYTRPNFIHADLDADAFASMQKQRGESIIGIMLRSMLKEMQRDMTGKERKVQPMGMLDLLIALRAPDRARQLKLLLGRQFDELEDQMSGLDGPDGSVIITERNKKCIETLVKAIADGHKNIGVFYGGAHMRDMSQRVEAMGFHQTAVEWRVSWDMTGAEIPSLQLANRNDHRYTSRPGSAFNMGNAEIRIRRASLAEIIDLRHAILRAGLPRETAVFPGDELASSQHYAAFLSDDSQTGAVGCATFHLNQWEGEAAWQLRGMATADSFRRKGLGRNMLAVADRELLADPSAPRLFWCNARVPAMGFYQLLGWKVVSEPFEIPTAGPHVKMVRRF